MIQYMPHEKTRSNEKLAKLMGMTPNAWLLDPASRIERDAASIANAMASIHGGEWRVQIDHLAGLVLVVRH